MWSAKCAEGIVVRIVDVRIAVIEGSARLSKHQESLKVSLEQHVDVHPLTDVAAGPHIAHYRIQYLWSLVDPALHREPRVEISHVVDPRRRGCSLLLDFVCAEVAWLIEKLRKVRPLLITRCQTAKQSLRRNHTAVLRTLEI